MFSGGRDSTLAALRLHEQGHAFALVTVSSHHLWGMDRVRRRLSELTGKLPADTPWLHVRQPQELRTDTSFYEQTCLPCHHAYVVVASAIVAITRASALAFGYTSYQGSWPEQTPLAISSLQAVLRRHGVDLLTPVYDLPSREAAIEALERHELAADALEQKCSRQVTNVELAPDKLRQQVDLWGTAIETSLIALNAIALEVLEEACLSDFKEPIRC